MSGKENHDAKRFKLKQRKKQSRKKNLLNEQQTSTRLQTTAPSVPAARDVLSEWLNAAWYPEHTGRRQCENLRLIWAADWGRCDNSWLASGSARGVLPNMFLGEAREPIFFPSKEITRKCFGVGYAGNLDLDMIVAILGPQYSGDVINNRSGDRALWTLEEWSAYMNAGTVPQDRLPPPPMTHQHYIFNMSCLEISTTIFARRLGMPFLHRQLDPLCRFEGNLKVDKGNTAGLYFMSSKAGSFSPWHVDATGEVHWLTVVNGIKWVYILPPTLSVLDVWRKAEHGSIRADLLWLPDLCPDSPVVKQTVGPGQSILFPSGCLHAVYTETDSLALAGGWVDEYNLSNHLSFRKLELETRTLKVNRFPQFERVCWLLGQEYVERWSDRKSAVPTRHLMQQMHCLIEFLTEEAKKIRDRKEGHRRATSSLPHGWRDQQRYITVADQLRAQFITMNERRKAAKGNKTTRKL